MKHNELKKLKDDELALEAVRVRRSIFDLRAQVVSEKVKDHSQFSKLRGELARILTETSARRIAASPVASTAASRKKVSK